MASVTVTGRSGGLPAVLRWEDGELAASGPAGEDVRVMVDVLVGSGADVVLAGFGGGAASLSTAAGPVVVAATLAEPLDDVTAIEWDPELSPLPPGAVA